MPTKTEEMKAALINLLGPRANELVEGINTRLTECIICKGHYTNHSAPHTFVPLSSAFLFAKLVMPQDLLPGDVVLQGYRPSPSATMQLVVIRWAS